MKLTFARMLDAVNKYQMFECIKQFIMDLEIGAEVKHIFIEESYALIIWEEEKRN